MQSEFTSKFLQIEQTLNLYEQEYNGFRYWLYYRDDFFNRLNQRLNDVGVGITAKYSRTYVLKAFLKILTPRYCVYSKLNNKDTLLLAHARRSEENGRSISIYTDYFVDEIGEVCKIEYSHNLKHDSLEQRKDVICFDRLLWGAKFYIYRKKRFESQDFIEIKEMLEKIANLIKVNYNFNIDVQEELSKVQSYYYRYKYLKNKIKKIIDIVKPRKIVEVVSYNFENKVFTEVAHKKGILTIELQHGLLGYDHISYNYLNFRDIPTFPDKLLVFGEYWKKRAIFPIAQESIIPVGFPHLEQKVLNTSINRKQSCIKNILFISQGTIGKDLSSLAIGLNRLIDKEKYHIIYKLHPGEFSVWQDNYPALLDTEIEVISNQVDLYELFASSFVQIGVASTAIYEGLAFNLPTYIYNCTEAIHLYDLCENNIATLVDNENELFEAIIRNTANEEKSSSNFWVYGAINNIVNEIGKY